MPKQEPVLSQKETIELLLERSKRPTATVPIHRSFVQQGPQGKPKPGPLAAFVKERRERALQLFLLAHAVASGGNFSVTEWSTTWARCIGLFDMTSGPTAVSRAWSWLEAHRLIRRKREGRHTKITILKEDGKGRRYTHPHAKGEHYLQLPFAYWTGDDQLHNNLTLPGKAMLLVCLSLTSPTFALPQARVPDWYGLSEDTATRGLNELRRFGILNVARTELRPSLQSRTGLAKTNIYELLPPFDLKSRGMGHASRKKKGKASR